MKKSPSLHKCILEQVTGNDSPLVWLGHAALFHLRYGRMSSILIELASPHIYKGLGLCFFTVPILFFVNFHIAFLDEHISNSLKNGHKLKCSKICRT